MSKLNKILYFYLENYPYKGELSKTRITKMVYLADWESSIKQGKQITDIKWYFDHYGPYVSDVYEAAKKDGKISIIQTTSAFGNSKELLEVNEKNVDCTSEFNEIEVDILSSIIENTKYLNWNSFIKYVYSTYPIVSQSKYSFLNLNELAEEYKEKQKELSVI